MKKHISYPKIGQFRNITADIKREIDYKRQNGELVNPMVVFTGTIKLHGTNASVCYNDIGGYWAQSRERIITIEEDNAGFAFFAQSRIKEFMSLIEVIKNTEHIDTTKNTITIYGEWVGKGIQKGAGIVNIEKSFFLFGVKISPFDESVPAYWVEDAFLSFNCMQIYNIGDFKTFSILINFDHPEASQNMLAMITEQVEERCPVSEKFGFNGIGEGVVWTGFFNESQRKFKVKGEKHSISKVKTLASIDIEKVENVQAFVDYAVTENRVMQAIGEVIGENDIEMKYLGPVIKWVFGDIIKEEIDVLIKNNLSPKDIGSKVSNVVKMIFINKLNLN